MANSPPVAILPATDSDALTLSALENDVFWNEAFSTVAFGPLRGSPHNIGLRAESIKRVPNSPNQWVRNIKAVLQNADGKEEIVGFASWRFVTKRREEEAREKQGKAEDTSTAAPIEKEKSAEEILKDNEKSWGPGANFKFCEDAFIVADEFMDRSCEGRDYCKLTTIVISPTQQRRGLGTKLLSEGLKEADKLNLQCVLGASPEGEGLYKRFGFREYEVMDFKLSEYEGGEGMPNARHVVMHRPAQAADSYGG